MDDHGKYMLEAIEKAREGIANEQTPFGACVVKDREVVSVEHNEVWREIDITAHAEIQALRRACRRLSTIDLSGTLMYSTCEPCPMCFSACHWANIDTIVFGARIEDARAAGFDEMSIPNEEMKRRGESSITLVPGILADECVHLFEVWSQQSTSRSY